MSEELYPRFAGLIGSCPDLEHVIVSGKDGHGHTLFEDALQSAAGPDFTAPTTRDDICFWLYTSGSTGKPKGAVHVHAAPRLTDDLYGAPVVGLTENDIVYSVAKLFFAYGLGNAMSFPLAAGATTVLMPGRPTPEAVAALLRQHGVTVFFAVPTFYAAFLAANPVDRSALALRSCISAGEALPVDVGRRWSERYGVDILDGLGSTEMLHIFLSNRMGEVRYGTTGKPVPGYDVRLVGDDGEAGRARRDGRAAGARSHQRRHVLEQPRAVARDVSRRVDALRRQVHRGQGRLLPLLRPARRHAQGRRHVCGAVRGRRGLDDPSRTCSKPRWWRGRTRIA